MEKRIMPCEVYSRVSGYFRPVKQWNKGKQEEFNSRRFVNLNKRGKNMNENGNAIDHLAAVIKRGAGINENAEIHGRYEVKCYGPDGSLKWEDVIDNVITTVGKNALLDAGLAGSSYSVTGPYMGLISNDGYTSAPVAGDTMASHSTWYEAGDNSRYPYYNGNRKTCAWSAASAGAKALSTALTFLCETTGGTVKGCFIVFGTGAVATKGDANGVLLSAGLFSGGDKVLGVGDSVQVSYSMSI